MNEEKVYIELSESQIQKLYPLFTEVLKQADYGEHTILLAQIQFDYFGGKAVAVCKIIDNKTSLKLVELVSPQNVGKMINARSFNSAMKKANR